jgi:hypothetical protein
LFFAIGNFRRGLTGKGVKALFLPVLYGFITWSIRSLRKLLAELPKKQLGVIMSNLFQRMATSMGPMVFFLFENVACWYEEDETFHGFCHKTLYAGYYLSFYVALIAFYDIIDAITPPQLAAKVQLTKEQLCSLKLTCRQGGQALLQGFSAISAVKLLSDLGVAAPNDGNIHNFGVTGLLCLVISLLWDLYVIIQFKEHDRGRGNLLDLEMKNAPRNSSRTFNARKLGDDMAVLGLV